jgi:hypothetical protein
LKGSVRGIGMRGGIVGVLAQGLGGARMVLQLLS